MISLRECSKENKSKEIFVNVFIIISTILGTIIAFWLYVNKYLAVNHVAREQVEAAMANMTMSQKQQSLIMFFISSIVAVIFLIGSFIIYKIIFKIAKVNVANSKLIIAVDIGQSLSYLAAIFILGLFPMVMILVITNLVEIGAIYYILFKEIRSKIGTCIIVRGIIFAINMCLYLL